MALGPLGQAEPTKLAIAPLAVAREVVRLSNEENERIREARSDSAEAGRREARRQEARRQDALSDGEKRSADKAPAVEPEIAVAAPPAEGRGVNLNILA